MPKAMLSTVLFVYTNVFIYTLLCSLLYFAENASLNLSISAQKQLLHSLLQPLGMEASHLVSRIFSPQWALVVSSCCHNIYVTLRLVPLSRCTFANTSAECGLGTARPKGIGLSNFQRWSQITLQTVGRVCILNEACAHSTVCPFLLGFLRWVLAHWGSFLTRFPLGGTCSLLVPQGTWTELCKCLEEVQDLLRRTI